MAPKNSGPEEGFSVDNLDQNRIPDHRDPGNSSRDLQRQNCPADAVALAPIVDIVEQPAEQSRFRYSRESRTNGSILGVSSTEGHKTYPSIRVNRIGPVRIRISCVSKDSPYRPHPHNIVGRENCSDGVCIRQVHIKEQNQILELKYIGIQCTKREHYASTLQKRAEMGVDPFGSGFNTPISSNQSHYVRLAIEVFIPDCGRWKRYGVALSDVITDLPTKLKILHISHKYGSVFGGTQLTLLTSRLPHLDQLVVRFQHQSSGWRVDVRPHMVHHLVSLVVNTPPYRPNTYCSVPVTVHLVRPPTGDPDVDKHMVGEPCDFFYTPGPDYDPISSRAPKKQRTDQKQLHPALLLDQGYLDDRVSVDSPPEPQPSTSTGYTDRFQKLDQWYFDQVPTPQTFQELPEISRTVQQTTHMPSWIRDPLQGSSIAYPQSEHYQVNQLPQSSSISNSQTSQTFLKQLNSSSLDETNLFARQLPHELFSNQLPVVLESEARSPIQPDTPVSQGAVLNNNLHQWRSPQALLAQKLTPHSSQATPRSSYSNQSTKRNHSQIASNSSSGSNISNPIKIDQPLLKTQSSQTEQYNRPTNRSERPNSNQHLKATQGIHPLPHQQKQSPVASILERPVNQMFLEIPPTFECNMARSSRQQFSLVDFTEQSEEYSTPRSLESHELRYFETTQRDTSWTDILSSFQDQWNQQEVPTNADEQAPTLNINMATPLANHSLDIEILSLSDELRKLYCNKSTK